MSVLLQVWTYITVLHARYRCKQICQQLPKTLLHLRRLVWVQELIVSAAVLGAALGSAIGGWFSDNVGRKKALLLGDVLFAVGALLMAAAHSPSALITGEALLLLTWQCIL